MRKSLPNIAFLCLIPSPVFFATTGQGEQTVLAAENQQGDQLVKDSSSALQSWMAGLIDAIKAGDNSTHLQEAVERLTVTPTDTTTDTRRFPESRSKDQMPRKLRRINGPGGGGRTHTVLSTTGF